MSAYDKFQSPSVGEHGIPLGPYFYPNFLHRIADALESLNALRNDDVSGQESPMFSLSAPIALWNMEGVTDDADSDEGMEGWLMPIDQNCWVYVPYMPASARVAEQQEAATA